MTSRAKHLRWWWPLTAALACSNYLGAGPDPSRAGPYTGGAANLGGDGTGNSCDRDPLDLLLSQVNAACPDVKACAQMNCDGEVQQCLGPGYARGEVGGPCMSFVSCSFGCQCNDSCVNACQNNGSESCSTCLGSFANCMESNCGMEFGACQGTSDKPIVVAANLGTNVNALVVDGDALYFTTNNGVASVAKTGGKAVPLGGFNNLNGLAVGGGFIYVVVDTGSLVRLKTDGSEQMPLVSSNFGGGSGTILLDGANLFYVVGPYVRRATTSGSSATTLVDDVLQQGASSTQRLAFDAGSVYYIGGGNNPGSTGQLKVVSKDAQISGQDPPGMHGGTTLAMADGEIRGVVSDGKQLYFTDFASDGLKNRLEVRKLDPSTKQVSQLTSVVVMNNSGGSAPLATDGSSVFFAGAGGLFVVSARGGEPTTLVAQAQISAVALDDQYVYWAEQTNTGLIKRMTKPAP